MKTSITLSAKDGYSLATTLFTPADPSSKLVVINCATGVRQQVYYSFATYLCEEGFHVLCYDYRGIGLSKNGDIRSLKATMRVWGALDFKAVTDYIEQNYSGFETYLVGHSVGALILGMNEDSKNFEKFVFVSTQNAYVGHLDLKTKLLGLAGFGLLEPLTTSVLGYFPAPFFALGEPLPKGVSKDWRTLILHRKSTGKLLDKSEVDVSKSLNQKTLVLWASDDAWLTKSGVEDLLDRTYPNLKPTYDLLFPKDSPKEDIGHVNFFRSYNKVLWKRVLTFLHDTK
ncbi:alpha/beta hydrolase family protein [Chryseobacterium sp. A321]